MSIRILVSILFVCVIAAHGQLLNRRQPFNIVRQPKQLDADERKSSTQQPTQNEEVDNPPVNRATFERLFEAIRMINELLQTLSAIRARFSSNSSTQTQETSSNIPIYFNNQ